jgi:hypothetical protein
MGQPVYRDGFMMRNVALGAVLGFGLVVLLLSIFGGNPPPPSPAPPVAVAVDAGAGPAAVLEPYGTAQKIVTPQLAPQNRGELIRQLAAQRRLELTARDGGP